MSDLSYLNAYMSKESQIRSFDSDPKAWHEKYISLSARTENWDLIAEEVEGQQIYTFPLFTDVFCKELIELAEEDSSWNKKRHDHYPTTDKLLSSFGMNKTYEKVLNKFVYPAMRHLYSLEGENWNDLVSENFIAPPIL